jgi:outer membrane protein, heavy metal efflux system
MNKRRHEQFLFLSTASRQLSDSFAVVCVFSITPMINRTSQLGKYRGIGLCLALLPFFHIASAATPDDAVSWNKVKELALKNNVELQLARQDIEAAQADLEKAGLRPNPTLTVSNSSWKYNHAPIGRSVDIGSRIEQTIERGSKRELRVVQSAAQLESVRLDVLKSERQIIAQVASAIVDIDSASLRLNASKEISTTLDRAESIARKRFVAGDLSEVAADRVTTDSIRARNDIAVANGELKDAQRVLLLLLGNGGLNLDDLKRIDASSLPMVKDDSLTGLKGVDPRNPDLRASKKREDVAQAALDLAKSQRIRDVSVGLQVDKQPYVGGAYFGVSFSVPLFVFNDYSAEIRRAGSERLSAELETRRLRAQIESDQTKLKNALLLAREREIRLREQALPLAQRNSKTVEFSFQRGASSVLDVLDAERTLRGIQIEVINARADRLRAETAVALIQEPQFLADSSDSAPQATTP